MLNKVSILSVIDCMKVEWHNLLFILQQQDL